MERGFFSFPVEIERALPTSTTTLTTTATTVRLIPAILPTQSTNASLPTSSTRFKIVEDALKGFNLTQLTKFEREYPDFDFDHKINTYKLNLLILVEASNSTSTQLPTAEMETLTQMVIFMSFCMMVYIIHKVLICVYTEAVRELERASFFERETPYTIFCLWVQQVLGKCYPPIWCSRRNIRRNVLADIQEHFNLKAATLNSLGQAQTPIRRRQAAPDDSKDSDDAYTLTLKSIKDTRQAIAAKVAKGTPHPSKLANKEFEVQAPKRGMLATPRMVVALLPDVIEYDIPCNLNQTNDPVLISPDMIRKTRIEKRLSEILEDPGYVTGLKSQSDTPSLVEQESSNTAPSSRPVPNLSGSVAMSRVTETSINQSAAVYNMSGMTIFTPLGATNAPSMQGEESVRDPSVTMDPTRLGARPKTPRTPILEKEEEDDLSEKVTSKDLVTGGARTDPSVTKTEIAREAVDYSDEPAVLAVQMTADFIDFMTVAAKSYVKPKEASHLEELRKVTFSPILKKGTPGLSSTGNSELTSSLLSTKV
jgi:hypothetical protein